MASPIHTAPATESIRTLGQIVWLDFHRTAIPDFGWNGTNGPRRLDHRSHFKSVDFRKKRSPPRSWYASMLRFEDDRNGPIEAYLQMICCSLVLVAEFQWREQELERCRYRQNVFDDELRKVEQRRREARESAKAKLVGEARAHREAEDIRRFVASARQGKGTESLEFASWQQGALGAAEEMDPLGKGECLLYVPPSVGST